MSGCRDERGFSAPELLTALAMLALVLAGITTIHQSALRAYVSGSNKTEVDQNARVALERMAREIRQTRTGLTLATGTSLTFLDQDAGVPVTYALAGNAPNLSLTRTVNGVAETVVGRVQTLTLAYRDVNENILAVPVGTPANVRTVAITVQTSSEDTAAHGFADARAQLTTSVRLRNL